MRANWTSVAPHCFPALCYSLFLLTYCQWRANLTHMAARTIIVQILSHLSHHSYSLVRNVQSRHQKSQPTFIKALHGKVIYSNSWSASKQLLLRTQKTQKVHRIHLFRPLKWCNNALAKWFALTKIPTSRQILWALCPIIQVKYHNRKCI